MSASPVKPRPRPRPRPRNTASSTSEIDKPGSSSKSTLQDEEDAMFIRNRNRNASSWSKLNAAVEEREAARSRSVDLFSDDSGPDESPRTKRARRLPFAPKTKELPAWARSDELIHLKDSGSDRDKSDDDLGILVAETQKDGRSSQKVAESKRKRQRSHSRSDSDDSDSPPEVEVRYAEQIGRERARQILANQSARREKTPIYNISSDADEADNIMELPAELAAIRAEVTKNTSRVDSVDNNNSSVVAMVEFTIILRPHPEDESGRSYVYSHSMRRNEKFEQLFIDIADEAGIPSKRLIVLYNNRRVYPWSSPQTLSIWSKAELTAYEEHVYKYVKAHGERSSTSNNSFSEVLHESSSNDCIGGVFSPEPNPSQEQTQSSGSTFKLQVRLGEQTVTVGVRSTTKCGSIIEKVLAKMGKAAGLAKKARIEVDGEKLNSESEIGEVELEDGDLIDIVGV